MLKLLRKFFCCYCAADGPKKGQVEDLFIIYSLWNADCQTILEELLETAKDVGYCQDETEGLELAENLLSLLNLIVEAIKDFATNGILAYPEYHKTDIVIKELMSSMLNTVVEFYQVPLQDVSRAVHMVMDNKNGSCKDEPLIGLMKYIEVCSDMLDRHKKLITDMETDMKARRYAHGKRNKRSKKVKFQIG